MARITVEDCVDKVDGAYDLVLIAKERAVQLNSGEKPNVDPEKDKNTVIALKEIAENKVSVKELTESAINKLRKHIEQDTVSLENERMPNEDEVSLEELKEEELEETDNSEITENT